MDFHPLLRLIHVITAVFMAAPLYMLIVILGVRMLFPYNIGIVLGLIALAGLFSWRVFTANIPWGWI